MVQKKAMSFLLVLLNSKKDEHRIASSTEAFQTEHFKDKL